MKETINKKLKLLRAGHIAMLALLVIQFCAGMYLNFYTELPDAHPGTDGSYAPSIPWALTGHAGLALTIHVAVWMALTLGALALLAGSIMSKRKVFIVGSSVGLLFILIAGSSGLTFLNRGGDDKESFIMAIGFILAFIAYGATFYKTKESQAAVRVTKRP